MMLVNNRILEKGSTNITYTCIYPCSCTFI